MIKHFVTVLFICATITVTFADSDDDQFAQCCKDKGVNDACVAYTCKYNNAPTAPPPIFQLYHHLPQIPLEEGCSEEDGQAIGTCCQKGKNNTQCCTDAGVGATFPYCLDICDGTNIPPFEEKYKDCEDVSQKIRECGKNS